MPHLGNAPSESKDAGFTDRSTSLVGYCGKWLPRNDSNVALRNQKPTFYRMNYGAISYKMSCCFFSCSLPSHSMLTDEHRAEHVGFEPTDAVTRINALAVRPNRPLWQCSARHSTGFICHLQRRGQPIYGLTCPMRSRRGSNPLIPSSGTRRFSRPVPYRSATAPRQAYRCPSRRFEAIFTFGCALGGVTRIRTEGTAHTVQRFSRPPHSAALP